MTSRPKKTLIVINGTMGVGKSAVCRCLLDRLKPSVLLEGDWCWMMNPFTVTPRSRRLVENNISHLLTNFLDFPEFRYVIFGWVLHRDEIYYRLLKSIRPRNAFNTYRFTLTCSKEALKNRVRCDIAAGLREQGAEKRSIARLRLYDHMDSQKIDNSLISAEDVSTEIIRVLCPSK